MEILVKKTNNLVIMLGSNITYVYDQDNKFYYSVNLNKPWEIEKVYVNNENDFKIIDVTGISLPQDNIEFKYIYDEELREFYISEEWINNQTP